MTARFEVLTAVVLTVKSSLS